MPYADKDADLVSYWRFEGDATDEVGNNDGVMDGVVNTTGIFNDSFAFDGSNDAITVPFDASLNPDYITISIWYNITSGTIAQQTPLIQKAKDTHTSPYYQYTLFVIDTASHPLGLTAGIAVGSTYYNVLIDNTISYDTWEHCALTYDGSILISYHNGIEIGNVSSMSGVLNKYTSVLEFGDYPNLVDSTLNNFDGKLDEAKLYNRALSASEILTLYNDGQKYVSFGNYTTSNITTTNTNKTIIDHSYITANTPISQISWLQLGIPIAYYNTTITSGTTSSITVADLSWGSYTTLSDYQIKIDLTGNGSYTPQINNISILLKNLLTTTSNYANSTLIIPILTLTKITSHIEVDKGDTVNYLLYINNTGNDTATDVWLNDTIDSDTQHISSDSTGTSGQRIYWYFATIPSGSGEIAYLNITIKSTAVNGQIIFNNFTANYSDSYNSYTGTSNSISMLLVIGGEGLRVTVSALYHAPSGDYIVFATVTEGGEIKAVDANTTANVTIYNKTLSTIVLNASMHVFNGAMGMFNYTNTTSTVPYIAFVEVNTSDIHSSGSAPFIPYGEDDSILTNINNTLNSIDTKIDSIDTKLSAFWADFNSTWITWESTFFSYWAAFNTTEFFNSSQINDWFNTTWNITQSFETNITTILTSINTSTNTLLTELAALDLAMTTYYTSLLTATATAGTNESYVTVQSFWSEWNTTMLELETNIQTAITPPSTDALSLSISWIALAIIILLIFAVGTRRKAIHRLYIKKIKT